MSNCTPLNEGSGVDGFNLGAAAAVQIDVCCRRIRATASRGERSRAL